MIGRLQGKLVELSENVALLDVAGVGYEVELSGAALGALPLPGGDITVHTHFVVREDAQALFGFASRMSLFWMSCCRAKADLISCRKSAVTGSLVRSPF